jgi:DNA-binding NarL/FixJ family response regulator
MARVVPRARAELGEEAFTTAWAEGRGMTLEQALEALRSTVRAKPTLGLTTRRSITTDPRSSAPSALNNLTKREYDVLRLVAQGLSDAQVAEALVISPRTVNAHLRSIYRKLDITSRHAATLYALEHHLN